MRAWVLLVALTACGRNDAVDSDNDAADTDVVDDTDVEEADPIGAAVVHEGMPVAVGVVGGTAMVGTLTVPDSRLVEVYEVGPTGLGDLRLSVTDAMGFQSVPGDGTVVADVDADGVAEVALATRDRVVVFSADGSALDASDATVSYAASQRPLAGLGDLDGDGGDELAIGPTVLASATWATDPAAAPYGTFSDTGPWWLTGLGDVDGDGRDDVAAIQGGVAAVHTDASSVRALEDADGTVLPDIYQLWIAPAGDTNGDGLADLIVTPELLDADTGCPPPLGPSLFLAPFAGPRDLVSADATLILDGHASGSPLGGDLDGDGIGDVVASLFDCRDGETFEGIWLGPSAGTLAPDARADMGWAMGLADVDADAKSDVIGFTRDEGVKLLLGSDL